MAFRPKWKKTAAATGRDPLWARVDEAEAGLDEVLMNVAEEGERLGREAMPAPGADMEPIKVPDAFRGDAQLDFKPAPVPPCESRGEPNSRSAERGLSIRADVQ